MKNYAFCASIQKELHLKEKDPQRGIAGGLLEVNKQIRLEAR
jgi:hypothetical protein